jgi:hypothetical protein
MDFKIDDEVVVVSAGSKYTKESWVGLNGYIKFIHQGKTATVIVGWENIHVPLSDLELRKEHNHIHTD